jgi:adenine deaminase
MNGLRASTLAGVALASIVSVALDSTGVAIVTALLAVSAPDRGYAQSPPTTVLFQNVRVFDGKATTLSAPTNVLVRGNTIEKITTADIPTDRSAATTIINGNGRTLMPGLSDMHWHAMLVRPTPPQLLASDIGYTNLLAGAEASA